MAKWQPSTRGNAIVANREATTLDSALLSSSNYICWIFCFMVMGILFHEITRHAEAQPASLVLDSQVACILFMRPKRNRFPELTAIVIVSNDVGLFFGSSPARSGQCV